jgi:hypothetical protein
MQIEETYTEKVKVDLGDGIFAYMEVAETEREKVGAGGLPFSNVTAVITKISQEVGKSIQKVQPKKATIKYGVEVGIEQGSLMASIVRGSGKANLEITLEW